MALAVTVAVLWYVVRHVDLHQVVSAIRGADLGLLALTVLVTFVTYLFRTWRWQALLVPIGRAPFGQAFRATVIGFTATFLLPGRVGEVLRPYLLARHEGFRFTSTFATIIIERLLDVAAVLLLFGWFLVVADTRSFNASVWHIVKFSGAVGALVALGALAVLFLCAGHPERLGQFAGRMSRVLPAPLAAAVARLVRTFAEGLAVMRRPRPLVVAAMLSVPMWLSIAVGIWLTSRAFGLTVPFTGSFLIMMFLVIGVAVPTPGGVGAFEAAYIYAVTTFFGVTLGPATAASLVLHAVSFVPVSILGLLFMGQDGLTLAGLRKMQAAAADEEKDAEVERSDA